MIGAIIGDIVGSRFEWDNHRGKDFELFTPKCFATDDSIMTLAIAEALMRAILLNLLNKGSVFSNSRKRSTTLPQRSKSKNREPS